MGRSQVATRKEGDGDPTGRYIAMALGGVFVLLVPMVMWLAQGSGLLRQLYLAALVAALSVCCGVLIAGLAGECLWWGRVLLRWSRRWARRRASGTRRAQARPA